MTVVPAWPGWQLQLRGEPGAMHFDQGKHHREDKTMDPNATLEAIRSLVGDVLAGETGDASHELDTLAEHFRALDEWLSRGGFLPQAWQS